MVVVVDKYDARDELWRVAEQHSINFYNVPMTYPVLEVHHDLQLLARGPIEARRYQDWSMAFSSYPSLNRFNMPGFFAVDKEGMNAEAERCAQA